MNPAENNPANSRPKGEERRIDLQAAYRVMIRAYLRRRLARPAGSEVPHE